MSSISVSYWSGSRARLLLSLEKGILASHTSVSILATAGLGGSWRLNSPLPPVARIPGNASRAFDAGPAPVPHRAQVHRKSQKLLLETNELLQSDTQCTLPSGQGWGYTWAPGAGPSPGRIITRARLPVPGLLGWSVQDQA